MMKLSVASQAVSPSTDATRPAAPEPAAELLHDDLEAERVARLDDALEAALVDAGEEPDPIAEPGLLRDVDGHRLGKRLDLDDARHHRQPREVALEEPLGRGDRLEPDDPLRVRVVLDDPVDEQERPAVRDQRLDLARREDASRRARAGEAASVTMDSSEGDQCRGCGAANGRAAR